MTLSRRAFTRPLFTQKIRNFPTLEQASRYIDRRLKAKPAYCFNIQQTAPDNWTVSRVISGGVA